MAEYIEKNDLREYIDGYIKSCNGKPIYTDIDAMVGIIDLLEAMPAADVQPVRHGRWIITDDVEHFIAICSECGRTEDSRDIKDMPYCHCGARMDGEQNETD